MAFSPLAKGVPSDFFLEVAKGNVPGHETRAMVGSLPASVGALAYEDLWSEGGVMVQPTAAETWEIVSDSAADTSAGTGARTIVVSYLDDSGNPQAALATMNGTTPVTLNSDHFRVENSNGKSGGRCVVLAVGSGTTNAGKITVRVSGGGATRTTILPGVGISENGQYTVPTGKTIYGSQDLLFFSKNHDGLYRTALRLASGSVISSGAIPFYQNAFPLVIRSPFEAAEGTDITLQGSATNAGANLVRILEFIIVDNDHL